MKGYGRWVAVSLVTLVFLAPLKFGTPVVVQAKLIPPDGFFEWLFFPWPNEIAVLAAMGALLWLVLDPHRLVARVDWLFVLPLLFLTSQVIATPGSICPQTTIDTLAHFAVCVLLFYAAAWYVRDGAAAGYLFGAFGLAVFLVLVIALEQYFGGLSRTREYAALYAAEMPLDLQLRLTSPRVFGTLVYPNALAGYLVLAFAPTMAWVWVRGRNWNGPVKWLTLVLVGGLMVLCLVLTRSRGGFIAFAAMVLAGVYCLLPKGRRRTGWTVAALALIAGVFVVAQQGGVIKLGGESVAARWDYWLGALGIARDHPWLGTGPGTFGSIYPKYKIATSEEAQLVHNNFLQMWSDSGVAGFVTFALLWLIGLRDAFALSRRRQGDAAAVVICAAMTGWVVHCVGDFDLYVPGVALPAFALLGTLQGLKEIPRIEPVTSTARPRLAVATVLASVVVFVFWLGGKALLAGFHAGQSYQLRNVDLATASRAAHSAIALNPYNPHFYRRAGELAVELGRVEEAIGLYRKAIESDPYRASYHWRLAHALMVVGGRESQAIEQFRMAAALNPTQIRYRDDLMAAEESIRQPPPSLLKSAPAEKDR